MENMKFYKRLLSSLNQIDKEIDELYYIERDIIKKFNSIDDIDLTEEIREAYYDKIDEIMEKRNSLREKRLDVKQKLNEISSVPIEIINGSKVDIIKFMRDLEEYNYGIYLHGTRERIGYVEYRKSMGQPKKDYNWPADIGLTIHEDFQRKGYATEALMLLIGKLCQDGIDTIYWSTYIKNIPSIKTIEKLGGKLVDEFSDGDYLLYKCDLRQIKQNNVKKR